MLKIIAYHSIYNTENFNFQIQYLKRNYSLINIWEFHNHLYHKKCLPPNPLLITFDDGDRTVFTNAYPILKKLEVPAILFVITDLINSNKPFWWDEIEYYLGKKNGNKVVWNAKEWTNKNREAYLDKMRKTSSKPTLEYEQLTTDELNEMQTAGIIIANHSHSHPMFDNCTPDELEFELSRSTSILKELEFTPDVFAYPNGNYSIISETILKKNKIKQVYLFDHKINKRKINPLRISRLIVNDNTPIWKFKLILSGWHSKILPVTKVIGKLIR